MIQFSEAESKSGRSRTMASRPWRHLSSSLVPALAARNVRNGSAAACVDQGGPDWSHWGGFDLPSLDSGLIN